MRPVILLAICCLFASLAMGVHAQERTGLARTRSQVTLYAGQGVDSNLRQLPSQILRGDLPWEASYFGGVGYARPVALPSALDRAFRLVHLDGVTSAVEAVAVKHSGRQHNVETGLQFVLHSPWARVGPVVGRLAAGLGLSYAWGTPTYEDGPDNDPKRRYRLQNFDTFEFEVGLLRLPGTTLVARVHHRSGMYGLIAPRHVGSNFTVLGIRHEF